MRVDRCVVWMVAVGLLVACDPRGAPAPEADGSEVGRLVIVGGGLDRDNAAVYRAILDGRSGEGPLCVVPTASGVAEQSMNSAVEAFDAHGGEGTAAGVFISIENPEAASDAEVAEELRRCSGFYFTGGQQSRILDVFRPRGTSTPADEALMERWRAGAVVAGSSAGAAMMSRRAIAGGTSGGALEGGVVEEQAEGAGVRVRDGMDFFGPGMVDQHFLARGRWGRLLVAVLALDDVPYGLGIDENTALVVDGDRATVVGASGVVLIDGRGAAWAEANSDRATVTLTLLGAGDAIDLRTLAVAFVDRLAPPAFAAVTPPEDPFARWALLELLAAVAGSEGNAGADGTAVVLAAGDHRLTLGPADGFRAGATAPGGGPEGTPAGLSVGPLRLVVERAGSPPALHPGG
jgi:cyanophycinase